MFPDFLDFFDVFWYDKIKNTGLQGLENQEIIEFGDFDF